MKKSIIIVALILVLLSATMGFLTVVISKFALIQIFFSLAPSNDLLPQKNVLVLGIDDAFGHRSDTIMVLHNDRNNRQTSLISIPRDTLANIPGRGLDKINHAYA
ncbi:MAG: LCP family protein, partial [bacterium]